MNTPYKLIAKDGLHLLCLNDEILPSQIKTVVKQNPQQGSMKLAKVTITVMAEIENFTLPIEP